MSNEDWLKSYRELELRYLSQECQIRLSRVVASRVWLCTLLEIVIERAGRVGRGMGPIAHPRSSGLICPPAPPSCSEVIVPNVLGFRRVSSRERRRQLVDLTVASTVSAPRP